MKKNVSLFMALFFLTGCTHSPSVASQQEVIVDIFSILVTVLMGWNIISVFDIKKDMVKVNAVSNDLEVIISSMIDLNFSSFDLKDEKETIIHSCFNMLDAIQKCENKSFKKTAEKKVVEILKENMCSNMVGPRTVINKDERSHYLYILNQIDGMFIDDVRDMISNAIEKGSTEERDYAQLNGEASKYVDATNSNVNH